MTKPNVPNMKIFVFDKVENIVGQGENAGYLFPQGFFLRDVKSGLCSKVLNRVKNIKVSDHVDTCESHRFLKNQVQIFVQILPRTLAKNILNLLKPSIPAISTSMLTIFSVNNLTKMCQSM